MPICSVSSWDWFGQRQAVSPDPAWQGLSVSELRQGQGLSTRAAGGRDPLGLVMAELFLVLFVCGCGEKGEESLGKKGDSPCQHLWRKARSSFSN